MPWDRRTPKQQRDDLAQAVHDQVAHAIGPFSPYWRQRLKDLGTTVSAVATPDGVQGLAPVGERDICPDGDPRGAASLVLQAGESGWAVHADGPRLRRGLANRLARPGSYRSVVEADTRATSFVEAGLSVRFPVASTRSDLDVVARAGARLWQVLGLTHDDVLVAALPLTRTAVLQSLELGALASGSPATFPGELVDDVAAALHVLPATVLALPTGTAGDWLDDLDEAGAPLSTVRTVLLVGAPTGEQRASAAAALVRAGVSARLLAGHVPDGHRLMWGECAPEHGLHTYPDLELVDLVHVDATASLPAHGELVLTQLGMRGSALLRWRTGDVVERIDSSPCPGCGRTVPRLLRLQHAVLVPTLALRSGERGVDLRAVTAAVAGRAEVSDWRVVVGPSPRDGADELVVHVVVAGGYDPGEAVMALARDVRQAAGLLPTQVVVDDVLAAGDLVTPGIARRG